MASKHQLSLELPDTNNVKILRVTDTSLYSDSLEVKCGALQIISPGFNVPVTIETLPNFHLVLNACTLSMISTGCSEDAPAIPDGIYVIKYSVSPNDKVYVEYNYLRVTQTLNLYNNILGNLELGGCEPGSDLMAKLQELNLIKSFIDAAKVNVEDVHEPNRGMELLLYAKKRLDKLLSGCPHCK